MKKFIKLFCSVVASIILSTSLVLAFPNTKANASFSGQFSSEIDMILKDYVVYTNRVAGSDNEKEASNYIINYLNNNTDCVPCNTVGVDNGIQTFYFTSAFDGEYYSSRNIIYNYNTTAKTDKKVIICCSYDSVAFKVSSFGTITELVETEGVNGSAGSVALLLAFAKYLPQYDFDFNIQFIFFGAGESNNAGSEFFVQGISEDDAKDILLTINLDNVAVGKNLYFYVDEIENDFSKYAASFSDENNYRVQKVSSANIGKMTLYQSSDLGLKYTHISLLSNNYNFMKSGVLTMNIFAGDYSTGITYGRCEYNGEEIVTYTSNDNLANITAKYGENSISDNLISIYEMVYGLLSDEQFETVCTYSYGQTKVFYSIFMNEKYIAILTLISIFVLLCIIWIIQFKLTKRAYYANVESGFVKTVFRITDNIGDKLGDEDITKYVSEILVDDIKKDKRIRGKKK